MIRAKKHQRCSTGRWLVLALAVLATFTATTAGQEKAGQEKAGQEKSGQEKARQEKTAGEENTDRPAAVIVNTLHGVVVSKKDGKPLANVNVAMADKREAYIYIGDDLMFTSYGETKKLLFFFNKTNGKTACEAKTDKKGRFTLKHFTSMSADYSIVAGSKEAGLAILDNVTPVDSAGKPLRIEIDEPAYLALPQLPGIRNEEHQAYTSVNFAPEERGSDATAKQASDGTEALPQNLYLSVSVAAARDERTIGEDEDASEAEKPEADAPKDRTQRIGPLAGGKRYRVSQVLWGSGLAYSPTLFEFDVWATPGKTTPIPFPKDGGTKVSGRIASQDGASLANVNVMVRIGESAQMTLGAVTDKDGNFTVANVPPGEHRLELLRHAVRVGPG